MDRFEKATGGIVSAATRSSVAIVDYGLANIQSIVNAVECFRTDVKIASTGDELASAEKIILPGVGHFDAGMRGLRARGHADALNKLVRVQNVPLLGICLGFQFLFEGSEEGIEPGLAWIEGRIVRFKDVSGVKVPHMGWSDVERIRDSRLLRDIESPIEFYFVHSYYAPYSGTAAKLATAVCDYGGGFVAALERDNLFATQFHPEKSQLAGMKLIETFLAL
jgi:imidazole glycerol-phosphate synthase subunit HisH